MANPLRIDHKSIQLPALPPEFSVPPRISSPPAISAHNANSSHFVPTQDVSASRVTSGLALATPLSDVPGDGVPQLQIDDPVHEDDEPLFDGFTVFTALPSWLTSMMVHLTLMLVTAFLVLPANDSAAPFDLVLSDGNESTEEADELEIVDIDSLLDEVQEIEPLEPEPEVEPTEEISEALLQDTMADLVDPLMNTVAMIDALQRDMIDAGQKLNGRERPSNGGPPAPQTGGGLGLRTASSRGQQALRDGGTVGSEKAVERALRWLAKVQNKDGGWDLAAGERGIKGRGPNGATGLALLPFLGAGHTHLKGEHRYTVDRGLKYLLREMDREGSGDDARALLTDSVGNYYSHGLCTIALCESYAMTRDRKLAEPAQLLLNEVVFAQDPSGGGWRYRRRQPGDTSVLGWQLMALKSGKMAYLHVPDSAFHRASRFLDSVEREYGATYGYTSPSSRASTTAVGLLSRMYLGWPRDRPALMNGVEMLSELGPDKDEIYFSYYATQVLHHYGGPQWKKWNSKMRYALVRSQHRGGANDGSWSFNASHNRSRLYCTAMATMILEVYYRHMPLYNEQATEE